MAHRHDHPSQLSQQGTEHTGPQTYSHHQTGRRCQRDNGKESSTQCRRRSRDLVARMIDRHRMKSSDKLRMEHKQPSLQKGQNQVHSPSTVDRPASTDLRTHRIQCAVRWADDPPRNERMGSHRHCTRTSPSETDTTHKTSSQHSADCQHYTARKDRLLQTRTRHPQQSTIGILCDW